MAVKRIIKVYRPESGLNNWVVSVKYFDAESEFGKIKDKEFKNYTTAWAYYKYKKTTMRNQNFILGKIK